MLILATLLMVGKGDSMHATLAAEPLLSQSGQKLFARLVRAFPGHIVLAQVALSRLVRADPRSATAQAVGPRHRGGVADFVLCRADFTPLAVVECDTGTDSREAAGERRRRKDQWLHAAGIKVLRFAAADLPTEVALKALVAALPAAAPHAPLMRHAS
jgi:hypothetical protein